MSTRRRPRGAAVGAPALYVRVAADAKAISETAAVRLGVSEAEFVEALLFHAGTTIGPDGIPSWWSKPVPIQEDLSHAS